MSPPTSVHHRLSVGANAPSLPSARTPYSRTHSHTVSLGSVNPANRINRRKSSTFSPAAIEAAVEHAVAEGSLSVNKRSSASKAALAALNGGTHPPMPSSLPYHVSTPEGALSGTALVDGPPLSAFHGIDKLKPKLRRASDGTRLSKKEKAAAGDLKCDHCGKAYKHGSCLNKHLWEHTPQWQYTSKLLISKHQQVQLLEAASVLVTMNQDGTGANDSDSSSPAASGSDMRDDDDDDVSSAETTPPPPSEHTAYRDSSKRSSNNSSAYSRSFQSVFSTSASISEHGFGHHRNWSTSSSHRPATANTSIADSYRDEDPQDLAAAVGLLSCSYGTPKSAPTGLPFDVPPVPPLPEKYLAQSLRSNHHHHHHHSRSQDDVDMDDDDDDDDDTDDDDEPHHARNDEVEEGMFGKMDA